MARRDELAKLLRERRGGGKQLAELAVALSQREVEPLSAVQSVIPGDGALVLWVDLGSTAGWSRSTGAAWAATGDPAWGRLPGTARPGRERMDCRGLRLACRLRALLASGARAKQRSGTLPRLSKAADRPLHNISRE